MAELFDVYESNGALIGAIPISPQQRNRLHAGSIITIMFHTPRMLREAIPIQGGQFDLVEDDGKILAADVETVKRYIEMQDAIAKAMRDPSKWIDPDAKSDPPVR